MNTIVENNYSRLKLSLYFLPLLLSILIVAFLYTHDALRVDSLIQIQKEWFYYLNGNLSKFPRLQYNLTQLGDAFIFLSLLTIFIVYAPKLWEALISASILSALFSSVLKEIFSVPRPAGILNQETFVIIGRVLPGLTSSLPSGHAITIFTVLTVLMFGFTPQKKGSKFLWFVAFIFVGLMLAFTRVAIGAHFPIDVIVGSIVGYISGLAGIFLNRQINIWKWISSKKYYPVFIGLFVIALVVVVTKIINENLFIFYLVLINLICSLFIIVKSYAKR